MQSPDASMLIDLALAEDFGEAGDITAQATVPEQTQMTAQIVAQAPGVLSGVTIAQQVFQRVDANLSVQCICADGDTLEAGQVVLRVSGLARMVLSAERTALNFLHRLSGIASLTAQYVAELSGSQTQLIDTRKTTPGWRALEKFAVRCGGGTNHRLGLYDRYLVKDNHIDAAGSITAALKCIGRNRLDDYLLEVEVRDFAELDEVLQHKVDIIMLDNFTPDQVREAIQMIGGRAQTEVSGGITLDTIRDYAAAEPDFISVGALTHSAVSLPFHMVVE